MIIEEMKEELGEEHSEVKNLVDELEFDSWKKRIISVIGKDSVPIVNQTSGKEVEMLIK